MSDINEVCVAIKSGDATRAEALVASAETLDGYSDSNESPVLLASYHGLAQLATDIAKKRSLDIHEATVLGDLSAVEAHLAKSPDATATVSADGWTPLHLAAFFAQADVASALIAAGAALDATSTNYMANSPLCAALAGKGGHALASMLVSAGADPSFRAAQGVTPLHLAASRGDVESINLLLDHGASRSAAMDDGATPEAMARSRNHPEAAALLSS